MTLAIPESLLDIIASYPYAIVFVGLLLGGETVLLPALYFVVVGELNGWYVMGIMVIATIISDIFWYAIGRGAVPIFIRQKVKEDRLRQVDRFSSVVVGKELFILFYSKFIYGTRIAAQVFCGAREVSFYPYLAVNTLAVAALGGVYYLTVRWSMVIVESIGGLHYKLIFVLALVGLIAGFIHLLLYRLVKKKWLQN